MYKNFTRNVTVSLKTKKYYEPLANSIFLLILYLSSILGFHKTITYFMYAM